MCRLRAQACPFRELRGCSVGFAATLRQWARLRAVAHGPSDRGNIPVRARPNPDSTGWLSVTSYGTGGLSRLPPTPFRIPGTEWLRAGGGWGAGRLSS